MASQVPATQRAWRYGQYGPVRENLKLEDNVEVPELAADQVLVKVKAAGLNPIDFARSTGKFQAVDSELPVSTISRSMPTCLRTF